MRLDLSAALLVLGTLSLPAQFPVGPANPPGPFVQFRPDLICTSPQILDSFSVRITVKNIGLVASPAATVRLYVPADVFGSPAYVAGSASVPTLLPGQAVIKTVVAFTSPFPQIIGANAYCYADPDNLILEQNESNNAFIFPWTP